MLRSAASKVMWVGRATVFLVGLAVILALVFGLASTVSAHTGNTGFFHLGHKNVSKAVSTLVKQGPGPAMNLMVRSGQPPLKVNSSGKVANLNADKVDGQSFACPHETLFHEGVCIETAQRGSATFYTAEYNCLDEGRRLPTVAELQTFRNRSGHDMTDELTSQLDYNGTNWQAYGIRASDGGRFSAALQAIVEYRCVVPPS